MRSALIIIVVTTGLLGLFAESAEARWHFGFWFTPCDCYWGEPSPWEPWWECPCYWDVWEWCMHRPYWMWPGWCRRYVEIYYSPCGRYYYAYYDYYLPGCHRVYVDGRYRYRYSIELGRSYSTTERIPRRNGLERPMPEPVERRLATLGPEYRVKTVAAHASTTPESRRADYPTNSADTRLRPANADGISPTKMLSPDNGAESRRLEPATEGVIVEKTVIMQNPAKSEPLNRSEREIEVKQKQTEPRATNSITKTETIREKNVETPEPNIQREKETIRTTTRETVRSTASPVKTTTTRSGSSESSSSSGSSRRSK